MNSLSERTREGLRLMIVSLAVNIVLAIIKVVGGVFGHSQALIADGVESSLDVLSSLMMWVAIRYAERPPDPEHPYGHGKMESLAAVVGSLFLILAGALLGVTSARAIVTHAPGSENPAAFTLVILLGTIALKELMFQWLHHRGKSIESKAVQTDALHHRSDALTSIAAAIGISVALIGGPAWGVADDVAALFSCALIIFNGLRMLRGSVGEILDEQVEPEKMAAILEEASKVPGVVSLEKCRVRKSGLMRLADLHVRVAGDRTVYEGHQIAHEVKDRLLAGDFQLTDVVVHIEPE